MAAADAGASSGALPNWVMLERFVFRRDDPKLFREDKRTSAIGETSVGAHFTVSFILAEPPTPSRLYLSWPGGPKRERMCHLLAAHRDLVLLRLDSFVDQSNPSPFGEVVHDYFIYIAGPRSQAQFTPVLRWLPAYTVHNLHYGKPILSPFELTGVGLLCCGEEFAVAYLCLNLCYASTPVESDTPSTLEAELFVFRSTVSDGSTDGGEKWEVKHLPIQGTEAGYMDLFNWKTNEVVPFKNSLCWVDYSRGILYCEDVCGDSPRVVFVGFPRDNFPNRKPLCLGLYRSLCVTEGGDTMAFLDVVRHDRVGLGPILSDSGFTITYMTLTGVQAASTSVVEAVDLWATHSFEVLPREVMMVPLLSMDEPNVAHFVLYDWAYPVGKVLLVTIDLSTKRMVGSVVPYINGVEDLSTDDADMVETKPNFFMHFLPTEFPKFLNLQRIC